MIRGYKNSVVIFNDKERVFKYLDDPMKLSGHMNKTSFMMAGSKMVTMIDSGQGREVGSFIENVRKNDGI